MLDDGEAQAGAAQVAAAGLVDAVESLEEARQVFPPMPQPWSLTDDDLFRRPVQGDDDACRPPGCT